MAGEIVAWKSVLNKAKLEPKLCNEETKEGKKVEKEQIKRVVREEGSGTTGITMKFFNVVNKNKEIIPGSPGKTWKQLGELATNTVWPKEETDPVIKAAKGSGVAKKVSETPSTFGYANVADARVNGEFVEGTTHGGPGKEVFWAEVENGKITEGGKKVNTYSDPATNGAAAAKGDSNCEATVYSNGKKAFPPKSANEPWNEVTTELTEKNYVICGFTYDLALDHYLTFKSEPPNPEPEEGEARTVYDYDNFSLSTEPGGGQALIHANQDYEQLPSSILTIAKAGVERINN